MTAPAARLPAGFVAGVQGLASLWAALDGAGEEARIVGGAVRDALLGRPVDDVDFATTATPDETSRRITAAGFKAAPTGIEHGTITAIVDGRPFEVTTLREDVETDGRRAVVRFGRDFTQDARRRDFTINALSASRDGTVHDPVGGCADLAARRVRFIGDADARIREDYLRILRFYRFHARYGEGPPDPDARRAIARGLDGLARVSRERARVEILKLLAAPRGAQTLADMIADGVFARLTGGVAVVARYDGAETPIDRLGAIAVETIEDAQRLSERLRLSSAESERLAALGRLRPRLRGALGRLAARDLRLLAMTEPPDAVSRAARVEMAGAGGSDMDFGAELKRYEATPPFLPTGRDALALGLRPGPAVGEALRLARLAWIAAECPAVPEAQRSFLEAAATRVRLRDISVESSGSH